jgi:DNA-binding NtrC family response regulator
MLLVENDPQLRRAMSILVESWGVSVIESEDAESALQLMQDLEIIPDALLLDYQLGDGATGTELFEELTRRLGRLPCAIITAERSAKLRHETNRLGIDLLLKPLDRTRLVEFLYAAVQDA